MGFSMLGSLGTQVFVGSSYGKKVKFQFFSEKTRNAIVFKPPRFGRLSGRATSSKSESCEFEERTSPTEVRRIGLFLISGSGFLAFFHVHFCVFPFSDDKCYTDIMSSSLPTFLISKKGVFINHFWVVSWF